MNAIVTGVNSSSYCIRKLGESPARQTGIFHLYVRETRPRNMREFMQTTTMFRMHIRPVASHCCLDQGEPLLP
jgi:hypothetical protein